MCAQYVCWVELAYVQLVTPRASLLCHLGGILAGLLHVTVTGARLRWPRPVRGVFRGRANLAAPRCLPGSDTGFLGGGVDMRCGLHRLREARVSAICLSVTRLAAVALACWSKPVRAVFRSRLRPRSDARIYQGQQDCWVST